MPPLLVLDGDNVEIHFGKQFRDLRQYALRPGHGEFRGSRASDRSWAPSAFKDLCARKDDGTCDTNPEALLIAPTTNADTAAITESQSWTRLSAPSLTVGTDTDGDGRDRTARRRRFPPIGDCGDLSTRGGLTCEAKEILKACKTQGSCNSGVSKAATIQYDKALAAGTT
jgi:hypothetical protein